MLFENCVRVFYAIVSLLFFIVCPNAKVRASQELDINSFAFVEFESRNPARPNFSRKIHYNRGNILGNISDLVFNYGQDVPSSIAWQSAGATGTKILGLGRYAKSPPAMRRAVFRGAFDYHDSVIRFLAADPQFYRMPMADLYGVLDRFTAISLRTLTRQVDVGDPKYAAMIQTHIDRRGLEAIRRVVEIPIENLPTVNTDLEQYIAKATGRSVGTLFWSRKIPSVTLAPFDDIHHFKSLLNQARALPLERRAKALNWRLLYRALR